MKTIFGLGVLAVIFTVIANLALLAGSIWVAVYILRVMGVHI